MLKAQNKISGYNILQNAIFYMMGVTKTIALLKAQDKEQGFMATTKRLNLQTMDD